MIKEIIDSHYTRNYKYYRGVCYNYCRGGVEFDDMLHELYLSFLKVNPSVINQFNDIDKLKNIGLLILRSLNQKRHKVKKNNYGSGTSPLFNAFDFQINIDDYIMDLMEVNTECKEEQFNKLNYAINKLLSSEHSTDVTIFLQATETSVSALSRESGISRAYLTKRYKTGQTLLKNEIK